MKIADIKSYLKSRYSKPRLDFKWSDSDSREFFRFLHKKYPSIKVYDDKIKAVIKQAFREYFEPVGYIILQFKDKKIRLKVFPYKIEPSQSKNLDMVVKIIDINKNSIIYNYNNNSSQIFLPKEIKDELFAFLYNTDEEYINKRELVKYGVRKALELQDNDIIVLREDGIFIKLLSKLKRKLISENDKNTIAGRFNGIDEDELIAFYDEYFSHEDIKSFFVTVVKDFIEIYFIENIIDNSEYEKNVFFYMQKIVKEHLYDMFDDDEEFLKGFSGYIFRIYFHEVFEYLADGLLYEVYKNNINVIEFLKYYSLNIIVVNGVKYRVPSLEADNGLVWNVVSIISVARLYMKVREAIRRLEDIICDIDDELYSMFIDGRSPVEYNAELAEYKNEITDHIAELIKELKVLSDKYDKLKDISQKQKLKDEIYDIKNELESLRHERDDISNSMLDKSIISEYRALEKRMEDTLKQLRVEEKALKQNEKSYKSVKSALAKALISKKKRLS